jgi:hypothetical protein
MPILLDITINLTVEELLAAQRQREHRPSLVAVAKKAIALGKTLFAPAAVYDEFEVRRVAGERVELAVDGAVLTVGPMVHLLAPAKRLLVAVYTIGPELEERVRELHEAGELLLSYMLDCVGVMAVGKIGGEVGRLAEERAAERGWGVSPGLSPGGLVGWPVQGQRELCALLPLADIGVRLNRYSMLQPQKSASGVIGMGPGYEEHRVGTVCRYCNLKNSCWRSKSTTQQIKG